MNNYNKKAELEYKLRRYLENANIGESFLPYVRKISENIIGYEQKNVLNYFSNYSEKLYENKNKRENIDNYFNSFVTIFMNMNETTLDILLQFDYE